MESVLQHMRFTLPTKPTLVRGAKSSLAEHPEFDFDRAGTTVRVRVITFPLSLDGDW